MSNKKVLVITGTRAEYGLLKSTIEEIIKSKKLKLKLLVTGMHTLEKYGKTINDIKKNKIPINNIVKIEEKDDMLSALSKEIVGISKFVKKNKPDLILVLGDRDEAFAGAIVGGHLKIPIAHIHGGDLTASIVDGPIRDSITKFAHLHFTVCKSSFKRVVELQEEPRRVFLVGAPGLDGINKKSLLNKKNLAQLLKIDKEKKWLLFLIHPAPLDEYPVNKQIINPLKAINKLNSFEKIIIYPNSDTGNNIFIREINKYKNYNSYNIYKNLPRNIYLSLLNNIDIMIGNSSSGIMESSFFKLPVVNIGNRQKNRERGKNVIDSDYQVKDILKSIDYILSKKFKTKMRSLKNPYGNGTAGKKIIKILENTNYNNLFNKKSVYG